MKHSLREMSSPRTEDGAVSAMYTGAECIANPQPSPYKKRPRTRTCSVGAASEGH